MAVQPRRATETERKIKPRSDVCLTLRLRSNQQPVPCQRVNFKKTADLDKVQLEPAIWSRDTGQRIPRFDRCQLTTRLMSNIKDVCDRAQKPLDMRTRIILVLPPFHFQNGGRQIKIQHVIVDAVAPLSFL